jgi:SAM-dependent methyltransferase
MVEKEMNITEVERDIIPISLDETHYKIMDLISPFPEGVALDFPAGSGRLSWWLYKKGFKVIAGDSKPELFQNPEIPIIPADIDGIYPFLENSFDYTFCVDGPEHVENPYHTFREFARILKPEGKMIISYPNYSNMESRLRNIFYGVLEPVEPFGSVEKLRNKGIIANGHINRQPYALLRMALEHAGFKIDTISSEKVKKNQRLLLPLFFLIQIFTKIKGKKGIDKYWLHESNSYNVLMGGNDLILICSLKD